MVGEGKEIFAKKLSAMPEKSGISLSMAMLTPGIRRTGIPVAISQEAGASCWYLSGYHISSYSLLPFISQKALILSPRSFSIVIFFPSGFPFWAALKLR
ncbi:MAG TPA: hypothetical protein ENK84_00450 [Desulfobulbus sp.]|nr:hypothetical protein [Desulfobulbus sp.]